MTAPVWVTPPGDLGTVVEGEFYQVQLDALNATQYQYLSGVLPVGIRVTENGVLEGNPKNYDYIQGVPIEIAQDVTAKFIVRAVSLDGTVADRVFEMTVTGQDAPSIDSTPLPDLGTYFDGDKVDVQLTMTDPDPGDTHTWSYQSGNLPTGVTVSSSGRIFGYIEPFVLQELPGGFDNSNFDMAEWDFRTKAEDKTYEFVVQVTDGKQTDVKAYNLYGISRNMVTADLEKVTADQDKGLATQEYLDILALVDGVVPELYEVLDCSQTNLRAPVLLTESTGLGRITHDNNFQFKFEGKDFDGDAFEFVVASGTLPTGLRLDSESGWLSGTIPSFSSAETDFTFTVQVRKKDNSADIYGVYSADQTLLKTDDTNTTADSELDIIKTSTYTSDAVSFTMTIVGDADSAVTWPSDSLTIKTGEICQLDVVATIADGRPVEYELKEGSTKVVAGNFVVGQTYTIVTQGTTDYISIGSINNSIGTSFTATGTGTGTGTASLGSNRLPQGLSLNYDGLIIGRCSFEHMMFDTGGTTFDLQDLFTNETTFESIYEFVVRVYSADLVVDTYKKFTITLEADTNKPYETLFARALSSTTQREIYEALIQNNDDIPSEDVYRASDFAFGIQKDVRCLIATGLNSKAETDYVEAMSKNFYNNTLRFGDFKTAIALNDDGTTKYEIVYIQLHDNSQGIDSKTGLSASPALVQDVRSDTSTWTNPILVSESFPDISMGHYLVSQANDYNVYPNSFENMRDRLKTDIGFQILERKVLPDWMQDKQEDNSIIGWTLAVPVVYCKPGTSKKIKYRLEERVVSDSYDIKKISFEVDRFILDNNLSKWYNQSAGSFNATTSETIFDSGTLDAFTTDNTLLYASSETLTADASPSLAQRKLSTTDSGTFTADDTTRTTDLSPTRTVVATTFDGNGTRWFAFIDDPVPTKDEEDIYLKFPQVGVFDRLPYTER